MRYKHQGSLWEFAVCKYKKKNVDLEIVLSYFLTAVPFSLAYGQVDMVSINKINKATLMTKREEMVRVTDPVGDVQVTIISAGVLLHALPDLRAIFGEVASLIPCKTWAMSSRVALVCDTYQNPFHQRHRTSQRRE